MQIEISLLQHMISISTHSMFPAPAPPRPADFDPFPAPTRTVGKGGGSPPRRFLALPLPAPPRPVKKIASPSIPDRGLWFIINNINNIKEVNILIEETHYSIHMLLWL